MRMSVLFTIIVYPKITIDSVTMSHILSCSRGPHPAEAYVSEVQLMKNLKKQKIKNAAALAACIVLASQSMNPDEMSGKTVAEPITRLRL